MDEASQSDQGWYDGKLFRTDSKIQTEDLSDFAFKNQNAFLIIDSWSPAVLKFNVNPYHYSYLNDLQN
jgi:hypothetical protein